MLYKVARRLYRRRCEPGLSRRHLTVIGLSLVGYAWLNYPIAWRAFARLVAGRTSWPKTRRNAERAVPAPRAGARPETVNR